MSDDSVEVRFDPEASAYVVLVDGVRAGEAQVQRDDGVVTFVHTELDPAFGGRGLGSRLVGGALALVRDEGLKVRVRCHFVHSYLAKHPEAADVVE